MNRMDFTCFQMNRAFGKHSVPVCNRTYSCFVLVTQIGADYRCGIISDIAYCALTNHRSAIGTGTLSHLNHPVSMFQNLGVMIDDDNRIAVCLQVIHDAEQSFEIEGMQTNGRFIKNIEHTGCAVAHSSCKLYPLSFTGRQCRGSTVERKIAKAKVHQPL